MEQLEATDRKLLSSLCPFTRSFSKKERELFENLVSGFLKQTQILAHELDVTRVIELEVAGWSVLPVLKLPAPLCLLSGVKSIKLFAGRSVSAQGDLGQILPGSYYAHIRIAWQRQDERAGTLIHELAHALDLLDRRIDDDPGFLLLPRGMEAEWNRFFDRDFVLKKRTGSGQTPWRLFSLDSWGERYGSAHRGEMFAVSTEWFFTKPRQLRFELPELYEMLCLVYNQDPAHMAPIRASDLRQNSFAQQQEDRANFLRSL